MNLPTLHSWDLSAEAAVELQRRLGSLVRVEPRLEEVRLVAGADVSCDARSDVMYAGVVVLRLPDFTLVEAREGIAQSRFPYVPGLLSFREGPALLQAFARLSHKPDLVLVDGQGIAHPRRLGIASHLGLWLGIPTVGCAKSRLTGWYVEPDEKAGSRTPLVHRRETIGTVLRTKDRVKPLFISPGHLIDTESAVRWTLACCRGYRLPEPTRRAHLFVNEVRRGGIPWEGEKSPLFREGGVGR